MKKTVLSLALLSAVVLLTAASCGSSGEEKQPEAVTGNDSAAVTEETAPAHLDKLPDDLDYAGKDIRFAVWNRSEIVAQLRADSENGEIVNDAVFARNRAVEERLNVKFAVTPLGAAECTWNDAYAVIEKNILAGDDLYDIGCFGTANNIEGSIKHELRDLKTMPNLDLTAEYWAQGFNDTMYLGDKQFVCAGYSCMSMLRYLFVTVFNNALGAANGVDVPIAAVNDGTWTLDYLQAITKDIYQDLNGNGKSDKEDLFGFISGNRTTIDTFWINCETHLYGRDSDGYYTFDPSTDRYAAAVDKVLKLYYDGVGSYILPTPEDTFREPPLANMFAEGRAMTAVIPLYSIETYLRNMRDEFTVLPMPKLDEAQKKYYSYVQDQFTSYMIPATVKDENTAMVGAALECLESESYVPIFNAYYENALSYKYVQNEESVKMLRLIAQSVTMEPSAVFADTIGYIIGDMRGMVQKNTNTVASTIAAVEAKITKGAAAFKEEMLNYME